MTVDDELFPSNSSSSSTRSSLGGPVVGVVAGIDDEVVVEDSSSALKMNEPVELTPLELWTLRNEFVLLNSLFAMVDESVLLIGSLFHDMRLMIAVDAIDFIDDGLMDDEEDDDDEEGLVACVPVPSAV